MASLKSELLLESQVICQVVPWALPAILIILLLLLVTIV